VGLINLLDIDASEITKLNVLYDLILNDTCIVKIPIYVAFTYHLLYNYITYVFHWNVTI